MQSEVRHLVFRQAEVVRALTEYHDRITPILPPGAVSSCGAEEVDGAWAFASTSSRCPRPGGKPGIHTEAIIRHTVLVAALILFCRSRRIPLPASASKSLMILAGQTCLLVTSSG